MKNTEIESKKFSLTQAAVLTEMRRIKALREAADYFIAYPYEPLVTTIPKEFLKKRYGFELQSIYWNTDKLTIRELALKRFADLEGLPYYFEQDLKDAKTHEEKFFCVQKAAHAICDLNQYMLFLKKHIAIRRDYCSPEIHNEKSVVNITDRILVRRWIELCVLNKKELSLINNVLSNKKALYDEETFLFWGNDFTFYREERMLLFSKRIELLPLEALIELFIFYTKENINYRDEWKKHLLVQEVQKRDNL